MDDTAKFDSGERYQNLVIRMNTEGWEKARKPFWMFRLGGNTWVKVTQADIKYYAMQLNCQLPTPIQHGLPESLRDVLYVVPKVHFLTGKYPFWQQITRITSDEADRP